MPSLVQGVTVENLLAGRRFLIEWDLNMPSEGVTVYEVHRSTCEDKGFLKLVDIISPHTQFVDKVPFTFGVIFFYKVLAVDASGLKSDITDSSAISDQTFDQFEEKPFRATTVSFDSFVSQEVPTGAIDAINTTYTTASLYRFNSTEVFVNGIALVRGTGFTESNDQLTLTLTAAPTIGQSVVVNYIKV